MKPCKSSEQSIKQDEMRENAVGCGKCAFELDVESNVAFQGFP